MSVYTTVKCDICGKEITGTFFRYTIKEVEKQRNEIVECDNYQINDYEEYLDLCSDCVDAFSDFKYQKFEDECRKRFKERGNNEKY